MRAAAILLLAGALAALPLSATTLPPELKAYDFGEAYYVEDGGVVIAPYEHGFQACGGVETPEGVRIMPGGRFVQLNPDKMVEEEFHLLRLNPEGTRAFFCERDYSYRMIQAAKGKPQAVRGRLLAIKDFYLSQFRGMEPFDHVFTNIELHPGSEEWRVSKASSQEAITGG